eukprot:3963034-Ditylum_brightwellii.AAC.1
MGSTKKKTNNIGMKKIAHYAEEKKTNGGIAVEKTKKKNGDSNFFLVPAADDNDAGRNGMKRLQNAEEAIGDQPRAYGKTITTI